MSITGTGTANCDHTSALDTIARNDDSGSMATYPGGKGGAGVYQTLINLMPPHDTYIETHLGAGAIMRHKQLTNRNIGIDIDPAVIEQWPREHRTDVELVCTDAVAFLESYKFTGRELVYADPPYLLETRRGGSLYRYEYTAAQHRQLLQCLKQLPCKVMISGYWSTLYNKKLKSWHTTSFEAQTRRGTTATEWVWMNYPEPVALHDYRYLGDSFRERERIKRKKARWITKLKSMPRLEQQALLSVIGEQLPSS